jgi:hypothetical protein
VGGLRAHRRSGDPATSLGDGTIARVQGIVAQTGVGRRPFGSVSVARGAAVLGNWPCGAGKGNHWVYLVFFGVGLKSTAEVREVPAGLRARATRAVGLAASAFSARFVASTRLRTHGSRLSQEPQDRPHCHSREGGNPGEWFGFSLGPRLRGGDVGGRIGPCGRPKTPAPRFLRLP